MVRCQLSGVPIVAMSQPSKYWKLVRIDAAGVGGGYKIQLISPAKEFFHQQFPDLVGQANISDECVQNRLMQLLRAEVAAIDASSSKAELCLRCCVSHPILQSCIKRARLFGAGNGFTHHDLLPFVLNDDGQLQQGSYTPFSIEILRSFQPERKCSLAGWVDVRVKRHPELNNFLLECGLRFSSDWALLNKANPKHTKQQRDIIEVFHQIYRRDRPQQHRNGGSRRCLDPTEDQLQEMICCLRERSVPIYSSKDLTAQLKSVAEGLRQEAIWGQRGSPLTEPIEVPDPDGEGNISRFPSITPSDSIEEAERLDLQEFCYEQLLGCLDQGIRRGIGDRITALKQSPRRAHLAQQVKPAFRLLYCEGKSQTQIATLLGMTNQSQVSRILNPKDFLIDVRRRTLEKLLHTILEKAKELGLVEVPVAPDYLSNLMQQLDVFVDAEVFQAAAAEISVSKNRSMNSLYAQQLRLVLNEQNLCA